MVLAHDNPFSTDRVLRERYRLDERGWQGLLERLAAQAWRGAIVGPHGSGKTTLLEDLAKRLEGLGGHVVLLRLSAEVRTLPPEGHPSRLRTLSAMDVVLVDGAEQLPLWRWWQVRWACRHLRGLIITSHREGRLPTLRRCETTPSLLHDLTRSLGCELDAEEAVKLHMRHAGNLREVLLELYDRAAGRERIER